MDAILGIGSENLKPVSAKRGPSGAQPRTLALRQVPTQQGVHVLGLRGAEREGGSEGAFQGIREGRGNSHSVILMSSPLLGLLALSRSLYEKGFLCIP